MKHVHKSVLLWYSPAEMYGLVTDVARYPQFLPWCNSAQVLKTHDDGITARLGLAYMGVRQAFTTRNVQVAPDSVQVTLVDGPGAPVPNKTAVFRVTEGSGALGTTNLASVAMTTNTQGRAEVRHTLGTRAGVGNNQIEGSAVGFEGTAIFTASGVATAAAKINVDAGTNQSGATGQALAFPFVVVVTDAGHNRAPGIPVQFLVKKGGGNFGAQSSVSMNTDSDGRALAILTLGSEEGFDNNIVEASFPGNAGLPGYRPAAQLGQRLLGGQAVIHCLADPAAQIELHPLFDQQAAVLNTQL